MKLYNYAGNEIDVGIKTDKALTIEGGAADAKVVGDLFDSFGVTAIEPMYGDIPQLYVTGEIPTSKADGNKKVAITYISRTDRFTEYATLKVQGDSSTGYPKKNFTIKFYSDAQCTIKSKHNFKNWGNENKYVLKANWIDITHSRNVVTARLWTDVVKSRSDYNSLPAALLASPNLATIDGFCIKVYVNGVYQGRYTFNIPKDAWMYNMDDESEDDVVLCADSWDGGRFITYPALIDETDWTDEIHEDVVPQSVITKLNELIYFVQNSTDAQFLANISNYIDVQSFIDFYIFVQVSAAEDNCGKNLILMSYSGSKYYAGAYDLDSTWGLYWNGAEILATDLDLSSPNGKMGLNRLYSRIATLYSSQIRTRYEELRSGALSAANIIHRFEEFCDIMPKELVEDDYATTTENGAFVNIPSKNITSLQQIRNYVAARLDYVDSQILS